jgi:hypothetical protein
VWLEGLGKLKKKIIHLPACSIVTQSLRYRVPQIYIFSYSLFNFQSLREEECVSLSVCVW